MGHAARKSAIPRRTAAVAAVICAALLILPVSFPALALRAATQENPHPGVEVRVESFTPWLDGKRPFSMSLAIDNTGTVPLDNVTVRMSVYERARTRSELRRALDGKPERSIIGSGSAEAADLAPGDKVAVAFERTAEEMRAFSPSFQPKREGGIYPVRVKVEGSDEDLWTGWTALVFLGETPKKRLNIAWLLPFHHPYMARTDGEYAAATVDRALAPKGTLLEAARAIEAIGAMPYTLAPTPLTLDELATIADGYTRRGVSGTIAAAKTDAVPRGATQILSILREVASGKTTEIATVPYSRADVVTLAHSQLETEAAAQIRTGIARATKSLGVTPNPELLVPADLRMDQRAAAIASAAGARTIALNSTLLPKQSGIFGPSEPVTVQGRSSVTLGALLADEPIRTRLEPVVGEPASGADGLLRAQGVIAETAQAWFEQPSGADVRGLVVATTTMPVARIIRALAEGISSAPWLEPRTATQLLGAVPRRLEPQNLPLLGSEPSQQITAIRRARRAVEILTRLIVEPVGATDELDRLVLAAESADWATTSRGAELATAAADAVAADVAKIRTTARRVTLTSRTGQLPVTIINDTAYTIEVEVRLSSTKVAFPEGSSRKVTVGTRSETITIPAQARAAGAFGVDVELRTRDGAFPIGEGALVVRSTAVSSVALVVIGGGILFMITGWVRRGRRERKPQSLP